MTLERDLRIARTAVRLHITLAEAELFLGDGTCEACGTASRTFIDHDHLTGYVRGRLSIRCNSSLPEELNDAASVRAQAEILARYLELTAKRAYSFKYESYKPRKLQPVIVDGEVDLAAF